MSLIFIHSYTMTIQSYHQSLIDFELSNFLLFSEFLQKYDWIYIQMEVSLRLKVFQFIHTNISKPFSKLDRFKDIKYNVFIFTEIWFNLYTNGSQLKTFYEIILKSNLVRRIMPCYIRYYWIPILIFPMESRSLTHISGT